MRLVTKLSLPGVLLSFVLVLGLSDREALASTNACTQAERVVGKTVVGQGRAERSAIDAFLSVALSRYGDRAYRDWNAVPRRRLECSGRARTTCTAIGVLCRPTADAARAQPFCDGEVNQGGGIHASYEIVVDGGGTRDNCTVTYRRTRIGVSRRFQPGVAYLACPPGYAMVYRVGPDYCRRR